MSALPHASEDQPDRITSAVQPYFEGLSEQVIELVEDRYPRTIKALFELAIKLNDGHYGTRLSEAFGFFSDSISSSHSFFFLFLIDLCRSTSTKQLLQTPLEMLVNLKESSQFAELFNQLRQLENREIEKLILHDQEYSIVQWYSTQIEKLLTILNISPTDLKALLQLFHKFIANLTNPSHLLIDLLLQWGHVERAIVYGKTLPDSMEQSKSLYDIVLYLLFNNHCAEAMKLVHFIKIEQEKTSAVTKIIDKLLENKKTDQAVNFAKSLVDLHEMDHALEEVAVQLTQQDAVDRALTIVNSIMDFDVKAYTLSRLVNILASKGLFQKAIEIAFSIEDQGFKEDANGYIVKKLLNLRRIEEAIQFVERIENPQEKRQAAKIVESAMVAYHQDEKVKRVSKR